MNWNLAYALGFHPWEDAVEDPAFVDTVTELFEREESGREPSYADREDVQAAFRGWRITGLEPSHFRLPTLVQMIMRPDEYRYRLRRH